MEVKMLVCEKAIKHKPGRGREFKTPGECVERGCMGFGFARLTEPPFDCFRGEHIKGKGEQKKATDSLVLEGCKREASVVYK